VFTAFMARFPPLPDFESSIGREERN